MPKLTTLQVENLRNLHSVDLAFNNLINIIFGSNGSGKTSLLEAVSILAHGRSFRTRKYKNLIHRDKDNFLVFSKVEPSQGDHIDNLGISRCRKGTSQIRLNGANVSSANQLAQNLPLLCVNNNSFELLDGGPIERRMFFDWLVFHVKHDFGAHWKQYTKCVKQRNSLLRRDNIRYADLLPWDREIARLALSIEQGRNECLPLFQRYTDAYIDQCELGDAKFSLSYINGWMIGDKQDRWEASEDMILHLLERRFEKDKALGYSSIGSHKSDLKILIDGKPASEILSRGQQKVLIIALFFAKAHVFIDDQKRRPVFLLDDLSAELDTDHLYLLGKWLVELNVQSFITTVSHEPLLVSWREIDMPPISMFHVKQGIVEQVQE